jgi:hypothetical protein
MDRKNYEGYSSSDGSIQNFLRRLEDAKRLALQSGMPPSVIEQKANFDLEQYVRAHNAELRKAQEEKEPNWDAPNPYRDPEHVRRRDLLLLEN